MKKRLVPLFFFLFLSLAVALPAAAQEPDLPRPPLPPIPPDWNFKGLTIEYQRVDVEIDDQVATTHIDQLFVNDNDWMLEGIYLFPLPQGAAVNELTMWVDGEPIEAKILEADEARQIYDEIVRQLRDPALLEYVGTSAIQANVFPIPAHAERRIEIEYSQVLPAENGLIRYLYPQSTDLYTNTPLDNQSIRVEVRSDEEIRAIYSPSHPVAIDRDGDFRATIGYEDSNITPEKDFELYYTVAPEDIGLNLLSFKESGQDGFFLLLVAPTLETDTENIVAKDVILVLDTSGSMAGEKMAQAQDAALYVLDNLQAGDRFNIVSFSTGVRSYSPDLRQASEAGDYEQFIDSLEALGGTNISGALLEAANQADQERPTTIIFLTDGLATEGIVETPLLLSSVKEQTPQNVRLFAFGVGDDVDTFLLDSLSQNHGGTTTYVRPGQQIDEAVSAFYAKVSTPVLADISLDFDNIIVEQVYPQTLPDLFAGTQLVLAGRYRNDGPATITLNGQVNGRDQSFAYEDNFFRNEGGDEFIPRLWATRAIGSLLTQIRLHGEDPELVQSVVDLSIRYGIITPYTSYLIEEDDIFSQTGREIILEEAEEAFAAPAPASGGQAVDLAADQAAMSEAEAIVEEPAAEVIGKDGQVRSVNEVVRTVGSKTFVYRDGVWIDTVYNADRQQPQQVGFADDSYFKLLTAAPEIGQYLALGPRVLFVINDMAYEIVEGAGQSTVTLPETQPVDPSAPTPNPIDNNVDQPTPDQPGSTPQVDPVNVDNQGAAGDQEADQGNTGLCASAMIAPLFIAGIGFFSYRKKKESNRTNK